MNEGLSEYGIKELKDGLTLDVLKSKFSWILEAKIKDAVLGVYKGRELVWYGGEWEDGSWSRGFWEDGVWCNGKWYNGVWSGGVWCNGVWYGGTWHKGVWRNGVWSGGFWMDGIWQEGVWYGGIWYRGVWEGGEWKKGVWFDGEWKGGKWREGEWNKGLWYGGVMFKCEVYSLEIEKGEFKDLNVKGLLKGLNSKVFVRSLKVRGGLEREVVIEGLDVGKLMISRGLKYKVTVKNCEIYSGEVDSGVFINCVLYGDLKVSRNCILIDSYFIDNLEYI